jgi:type II secretory pathway pseudopilin PulG
MNTNTRKIVSLMLAVLALAALISLMPEHRRAQASSSIDAENSQVLAQQQAYLLHHDDAVATSLRQF